MITMIKIKQDQKYFFIDYQFLTIRILAKGAVFRIATTYITGI
jgi:hypothetical protein